MSFFWGDGFDCYALPADAVLGYWDSGTTSLFNLTAGRFSGSRGITISGNGIYLTKSSGSNDSIHHFIVAIQQTSAIGSGGTPFYLELFDNVTAQCSVVFSGSGSILLTAAGPTGTTLATYSGAITAANTWYAFEIEVVVSNTAGGMRVRKNGNTSNDFDSFVSIGNLDTAQNANNYANKLSIGSTTVTTTQVIDDLLWRSDASTVPWVGDIRCYTRRPDIDAAVSWSRPGTFQMQPYFGTTLAASPATTPRYTPFISQGGSIGSVVVNCITGYTGNLKCAIYAATSGQPSTLIQGATAAINNPVSGANTFTFSPPVSVAKGTQFFVAHIADVSSGSIFATSNNAPYNTYGFNGTGTYAAFPAASAAGLTSGTTWPVFPVVTPTYNADAVSEPYEDAAASYVYSSAPGAQDLYTLQGISSTPSTVVGVTTRGLLTKSDAGTRLAAVQLRSGATTVQSAGALSNSAWGWLWRSDQTDPATGAAWTVSGVAAAQIGAQVTG